MNNTPHNRKTDVDQQEFQHNRASDAVLLDILSSMKMINSKQDALATDLGEVRKSNDGIRDRLTRVEGNQVEMTTQIKETREYVKTHAQEEEKILDAHMDTVGKLQVEVEGIKRGFPKNEDGERDPRSHADDHEIEASKRKDMGVLFKEIRKWMIISFLAAVGSGTLYLLATGTKVEISRTVQEVQSQKPVKEAPGSRGP